MSLNPLAVAFKGKGTAAVIRRAGAIVGRYGFTTRKMRNALASLASVLNGFELKASLPVTAVTLARNAGIAQRYQTQGIEFAVHGLVHIDYSQLSFEDQCAHVAQARQIFDACGIQATGFRCPYLRWNNDTFRALAQNGFDYDSSQAIAWDVTHDYPTDGYRRALDFYRAKSVTDYLSVPRLMEGLVQIPYSVPDDEALVERLELPNVHAMTEIWSEMLARAYDLGELLTVGLHPERTRVCAEALHSTLQRAVALSPKVWIARLGEIATWWRKRAAADFRATKAADDLFDVDIDAPAEATVLARGLEVLAPAQPWANGYHQITSHSFSFRADKRPFIAVSPDSAPALRDFLRQQGYLVETSTEPVAYSFYLDRRDFSSGDERPLLTQLKAERHPLIRLARWPSAARSALCITGDIDAFTLWDYGLRAIGR